AWILFRCHQIVLRLLSLGLGGKDTQHPSTVSTMPLSSVPLPQGVHLTASGVVLTGDAHIESPVTQVIPPSLGNQFTLLIGLHSYRVNNAFLFSIRNKNRLQFGVQLLPRKVVVYIGGKQSVYFDYSIHDEQWHSFAIDIRDKTVSMFAECGKKYYSRETLSKVQIFDLDGLFTLGRMNSQSVSFEGVICQLDIIPSAQASANYCKYHGKHGARSDHRHNYEHCKHHMHYPAVYAEPEPAKEKPGEEAMAAW
uniref:Thrombospondin-like N-terminal domain-containing protein n=1 Tax=Chelonoidis abingdonii TaxID=106734 RepID=A0A8C0G876_CHEAB